MLQHKHLQHFRPFAQPEKIPPLTRPPTPNVPATTTFEDAPKWPTWATSPHSSRHSRNSRLDFLFPFTLRQILTTSRGFKMHNPLQIKELAILEPPEKAPLLHPVFVGGLERRDIQEGYCPAGRVGGPGRSTGFLAPAGAVFAGCVVGDVFASGPTGLVVAPPASPVGMPTTSVTFRAAWTSADPQIVPAAAAGAVAAMGAAVGTGAGLVVTTSDSLGAVAGIVVAGGLVAGTVVGVGTVVGAGRRTGAGVGCGWGLVVGVGEPPPKALAMEPAMATAMAWVRARRRRAGVSALAAGVGSGLSWVNGTGCVEGAIAGLVAGTGAGVLRRSRN